MLKVALSSRGHWRFAGTGSLHKALSNAVPDAIVCSCRQIFGPVDGRVQLPKTARPVV
jgi:hypothetical protein